VCFAASGIPAVKAAWEAGVEAGGIDEGAPGARPEYGGSYYSAYLRDPDGNRVEIAVGSD
jgi:catechol 2,3-dioxygenase-like lactoylglutathione lyase family enzyme